MKRSAKGNLTSRPRSPITKTHPDKMAFWDYEKNLEKPESYTYGSAASVHWVCPKDPSHTWVQQILRFLTRQTDCMTCAHKPLVKHLTLSDRFPEIAQEWHPDLNLHWKPTMVTALSKYPAWWICRSNSKHIFCAAIRNRTKDNIHCPFCAGKKLKRSKSLAEVNPKLATYWDKERNFNLEAYGVAADSQLIAYFICPETANQKKYHSIRTSIAQACKSGLNCSLCDKQREKHDVLSKTHPKFAAQWHKKKNGDLKPWDVTAGSGRLIWWKCTAAFDHEWRVSVRSRTDNNTGCPFCAKHETSSTNSFAVDRPDLLEQWHQSLNRKIDPHAIPSSYRFKAFWRCPIVKTHVWSAPVQSRAINNHGCPFCASKSACRENSLTMLYPEVAKQWHPTKNAPLTPDFVIAGSAKKVWWVCPKESKHEWETLVYVRTKQGSECPYCCNQKIGDDNSLAILFPAIAKQWHTKKNGTLKPSQIAPNSHKKVWWRCKKGPDHEWQCAPTDRVQAGSGCPFCAGKGNSVTQMLSYAYPEIAKQWHKIKNADVTPDMVKCGDKRTFWWICQTYAHHVWQSQIRPRIKSNGVCPICSSLRLQPGKTLLDFYPNIAKEWHEKKNKGLKPSDFAPQSKKVVFWRCSKNSRHVWEAKISSRTTGFSGCPLCKEGG